MRINGERVKQAREIRGLTQGELASRVDVSQPHISLIEQNAEPPSEAVLEAIALVTGFPVSFFLRQSGPDFPLGSLLYRKTRKIAAADTAQIRQTARAALELVAFLGKRFKSIPVSIPRVSSDPAEAAQLVRSHLGVSPDGPIVGLVRKLERAGVLVLYLPCEADGFDAFSAWSDEETRRPVIFLRRIKAGDRIRHTLSHELGHLVLHQDFLGAPSELDRQANLFAGEFLIPADVLRQEVRLPLTLTNLADLKRRWGVSMESLSYHCNNLELITARQQGYIINKMRKQGWLGNEPVQIPVETPRLLHQMIETAFANEGDAARRLTKELGFASGFLESLLRANRPQQSEMAETGPSSDASVLAFSPRRTFGS
jgi:Zn-dependent peptidase ImmA (M78 family)/DNA-binding XRE family transcriptional regulator